MSSRPCASSEGWLLGCSPLPSPFFPLASSAHYLLDFCHIPDKHLVIDEIQELLQLAQVRDKAFPDFLKEGIKRGVFHLWDISPHPQVHFPHRDATALLGRGRRHSGQKGHSSSWQIDFSVSGSLKVQGKRGIAKMKTSPFLSKELQRKGVCTGTRASWQLEKLMGRTRKVTAQSFSAITHPSVKRNQTNLKGLLNKGDKTGGSEENSFVAMELECFCRHPISTHRGAA